MLEVNVEYGGGPFFIFDCEPSAFQRLTSDFGADPVKGLVLIGPGAMTPKGKLELRGRPDLSPVRFLRDVEIESACSVRIGPNLSLSFKPPGTHLSPRSTQWQPSAATSPRLAASRLIKSGGIPASGEFDSRRSGVHEQQSLPGRSVLSRATLQK